MAAGFDIYDDCGLDRFSAYSILDAISSHFPDSLRSCTGNSTRLYLDLSFAKFTTLIIIVLSSLKFVLNMF
ncbi:hypothetical protein KUTeg_021158 [Tegillarca granosa]|uniref:Uncharacterized protein n=1 Tax=Tegillarca granosa TaxID=220873 RepID=A0ABQ9EE96_TEGGR|nr:hypothetical protein KUTeg_021158 [Tegillarca granosa]